MIYTSQHMAGLVRVQGIRLTRIVMRLYDLLVDCQSFWQPACVAEGYLKIE